MSPLQFVPEDTEAFAPSLALKELDRLARKILNGADKKQTKRQLEITTRYGERR
jgi:hypothetical protein